MECIKKPVTPAEKRFYKAKVKRNKRDLRCFGYKMENICPIPKDLLTFSKSMSYILKQAHNLK